MSVHSNKLSLTLPRVILYTVVDVRHLLSRSAVAHSLSIAYGSKNAYSEPLREFITCLDRDIFAECLGLILDVTV